MHQERIAIEDLRTGDGRLSSWTATLLLDGAPLGSVGCREDESLAFEPLPSRDASETLADLEAIVAAEGDAVAMPDGPSRTETLSDRLDSLAAIAWMRSTISETLATKAVSLDPELGLLAAEIPDGGTLDGAIAHLAAAHPSATSLNALPIDEAVLLYVSNS
jgi:hypothetical protein